jgi:hypothetical protein
MKALMVAGSLRLRQPNGFSFALANVVMKLGTVHI